MLYTSCSTLMLWMPHGLTFVVRVLGLVWNIIIENADKKRKYLAYMWNKCLQKEICMAPILTDIFFCEACMTKHIFYKCMDEEIGQNLPCESIQIHVCSHWKVIYQLLAIIQLMQFLKHLGDHCLKLLPNVEYIKVHVHVCAYVFVQKDWEM